MSLTSLQGGLRETCLFSADILRPVVLGRLVPVPSFYGGHGENRSFRFQGSHWARPWPQPLGCGSTLPDSTFCVSNLDLYSYAYPSGSDRPTHLRAQVVPLCPLLTDGPTLPWLCDSTAMCIPLAAAVWDDFRIGVAESGVDPQDAMVA